MPDTVVHLSQISDQHSVQEYYIKPHPIYVYQRYIPIYLSTCIEIIFVHKLPEQQNASPFTAAED